jgi:hypothetical protein
MLAYMFQNFKHLQAKGFLKVSSTLMLLLFCFHTLSFSVWSPLYLLHKITHDLHRITMSLVRFSEGLTMLIGELTALVHTCSLS